MPMLDKFAFIAVIYLLRTKPRVYTPNRN